MTIIDNMDFFPRTYDKRSLLFHKGCEHSFVHLHNFIFLITILVVRLVIAWHCPRKQLVVVRTNK